MGFGKRPGLLIVLCAMLAACAAPEPVASTRTPAPGVTLTPYASAVPGATRTPTPGRIASPTPLPTPTATPHLYSIVEGDTLIGIAFRFGLTLNDILAANPGIDPQFLVIGQEIVIPLFDNPAAAAAVPTPVGFVVPAGGVDCYPAADGSLWCFQQFENTGDRPVEGLSASFRIFDASGEPIGERIGLAPVNLLPPGAILPLAAWFPGAGTAFDFAAVAVLSALPVPEGDTRYLAAEIEENIELLGTRARVTGSIAAGGAAASFRLGLVALDAAGRVVGVRVLELPGPGPVEFEGEVYSLAGEIVEVVVVGEAVRGE